MAKTGISIVVSNTAFGGTPDVNSNSMLIVEGATAVSTGSIAFALGTPYLLQSLEDLDNLDITETNNAELYKQVSDFYTPKSGINNTGTYLWIVGIATADFDSDVIVDAVRSTVENGFEYRPRNILISNDNLFAGLTLSVANVQAAIDELYTEGFSTVAIVGDCIRGNATTFTLPDLADQDSAMVGVCVVTDTLEGRPIVGKVGGFMATLSVGTSIGDASLSKFASSLYFVDMTAADTYVNTSCSKLSLTRINSFGTNQYIFARTRPPFNGLWLNDGATCTEASNAISTLEAARTLASLVDDLREFFTPYLNNKIPVNSDGDIQSTYKQVVLANARSSIIAPYIASGDISDARLTIEATDNDMVTNRSWKVTLAVLPAPTLRWIDGYVFYVSSL